ncbi:hypothetical protein [Desulfosarcina cetonica]|uniref:hypothetical protein n=1 Tax=Desulfosarcina cetonica TaxID=90730 RepID=UPI0006D13C47|nr:hypothetical protein [Desulfosarcina cetonica]
MTLEPESMAIVDGSRWPFQEEERRLSNEKEKDKLRTDGSYPCQGAEIVAELRNRDGKINRASLGSAITVGDRLRRIVSPDDSHRIRQ